MTSTEDRLAIIELCGHYNRVIDGGLADRIEEVFLADATMSVPSFKMELKGTTALGDMARSAGGHNVHVAVDHIIDLDGDRAHHRCTLILHALDHGQATLSSVGYYDDDVVRTPAGWRFAARRVSFA